MCRPDYFRIAYEINPWMNVHNPSDAALAHQQWNRLNEAITGAGAGISLIKPVAGLPDMVFTANAGLVKDDKVILSNFRHRERQGEEIYYEKWFTEKGYHCHSISSGSAFEGAGDAIFYKDMMLLAHGFRTDTSAFRYVGDIMEMGYMAIELVNPHFYHLDTCLQYFEEIDLIIYYPDAFSTEGRNRIEELPSDIMRLSIDDAYSFVCNSVCINRRLLLDKCSEKLAERLADYGLDIIHIDTSEFMKSGGSVRCMVLEL